MFGPVRIGELWRGIINAELYRMFEEAVAVRTIKFGLLQWVNANIHPFVNMQQKKTFLNNLNPMSFIVYIIGGK